MFRLGERVYIITDDRFNPIPKGTIGVVEEFLGDNLYEVKFEGYPHNNKYKDEFVWTFHEDELGSFEPLRAVETHPQVPTLTIPLTKGVKELTGEFLDSEGNIYFVSLVKLELNQQE